MRFTRMASILFVVTVLVDGCTREGDKPTQQQPLTVVSWGGVFQNVLDSAVIRPAAEDLGYGATVVSYSGEYDQLAARIHDHSNAWDLVQVETRFLYQGGEQGLLVPIDWTVVDSSRLVSGASDRFGMATIAWSLVLTWNSARLPDRAHLPTSWADLFDLKRFPGPRCLRRIPEGNLELALLADGVSPDSLYTRGLDVERALRKLSSIRKTVSWWTSGTESEQKLASTCSVGALWNGRVANVRANLGNTIGMTYAGAIHQYDWWVVPVGAPHSDAAMRLLGRMALGAGEQTIAQRFWYGPVTRAVVDSLPTDLRAEMPSAPQNVRAGVPFNGAWWAKNVTRVTERWNQWLLEQ